MRGDYLVSGPGTEGKAAPGAMPAVSLAQTLAARATVEGTWYVRNPAGAIEYHVTRAANGWIYTTRPTEAEAAPAPREQAAKTTLQEAVA
jgi:hypothetical protein